MQTPTLYLRKETRISEIFGLRSRRRIVAYYRDPAATDRACLNPWLSQPTRRNKWVMFNCARYRVVWLPDLQQKETA